MSMQELKNTLEKTLEYIKRRIETNPLAVLNDAIDVLYVENKDHEVEGFSILISYGGPNVVSFNSFLDSAYSSFTSDLYPLTVGFQFFFRFCSWRWRRATH